jgi:hypothetical protein
MASNGSAGPIASLTRHLECFPAESVRCWAFKSGWVPGRLSFRVGWWMCYNRKAVKAIWKQESTPAECGATNGNADGRSGGRHIRARARRCLPFLPGLLAVSESRRCKLICNVCGYYMSCADYY